MCPFSVREVLQSFGRIAFLAIIPRSTSLGPLQRLSQLPVQGHLPCMQGVWSPSGGWYPDPIHWKRNTGLAILGTAVTGYLVFRQSAKLEKRYNAPALPIPSSMWSKVPEREEE